MSQLENETKNKKEHIKSLRNTISKHEDSMIQLENRFDSTRYIFVLLLRDFNCN